MSAPIPVDLATWPRREWFEHYLHRVPCTYALTAEVDVTPLAETLRTSERKTYLAQVWMAAVIVNRHAEFRTTLTDDDRPAVWDVLNPMFTVFNPARETFAAIWTSFDADFGRFHDAAAPLLAEYRQATTMFPQDDYPPNTFDVSSLPWSAYTGFSLQIERGWRHLSPILTLGRYSGRDDRVYLPVTMQIHHAAADGFHAARFMTELSELAADRSWFS